jgi:hypothetical protein
MNKLQAPFLENAKGWGARQTYSLILVISKPGLSARNLLLDGLQQIPQRLNAASE